MEETVFTTIYPEEIYQVSPPVTVVIGIPWRDMNEESHQLLSKILLAVKLSLNSIRVVHQPSFDLSAWATKPASIIAFVEPPKGLNLYEIIQTGDTAVIFSEPLDILTSNQDSKVKLWNILKTRFPAQ